MENIMIATTARVGAYFSTPSIFILTHFILISFSQRWIFKIRCVYAISKGRRDRSGAMVVCNQGDTWTVGQGGSLRIW